MQSWEACGAVCTGLLHRILPRLNKRRYPVLSVKTTLLKVMDYSSIGCIMLSKEEKSSFNLKQQCQLQLTLQSAGLPAALHRAAVLEDWAPKPPTERTQTGSLPHTFMTFSKPYHKLTHTHTHTHMHTPHAYTDSSHEKHCDLWVSSRL